MYMGLHKLLLLFLLVFVVLTVVFRYEEYAVRKNFILYSYASCDPASASCFQTDCDPSDEMCDTTPYLKVSLPAAAADHCLLEQDCESFSCDGITGCDISYCSESTLEVGEICAEAEPLLSE